VSLKACLNSNPAAFDKLIFGLEEIDTISALVTVRKHSFSRDAARASPSPDAEREQESQFS
jgi:hypothetical protein